jgi:hypothetical protein
MVIQKGRKDEINMVKNTKGNQGFNCLARKLLEINFAHNKKCIEKNK